MKGLRVMLQHAQGVPWCYGGTPWLLNGDFLIVWGARWGPLMRAQPYRWFTSWFLHQSFSHVMSNMLLFLVIAIQVWRLPPAWQKTHVAHA